MYRNYAYRNNFVPAFVDHSSPLIIGSCGTNRFGAASDRPVYTTCYPKGRVDYQLIYVASGKAHFYFYDGETEREELVTAGHLVLYKPHEIQKYSYYSKEQTEVFWVHFTGGNVPDILAQHGFSLEKHRFYIGTSPDHPGLFRQMIQEMHMCRSNYEELLALLFRQILLLADRQLKENTSPGSHISEEIRLAIRHFHECYHTDISIDAYAQTRHISVCWFIRKFKEHTGVTPMQYILSIRIAHAQNLLETTSYNVSEIAALVGCDNPLYFSRLFHKQLGMSPSDYRKAGKPLV